MATTIIRAPSFRGLPLYPRLPLVSSKIAKPSSVSFYQSTAIFTLSSLRVSNLKSLRRDKFLPFSSQGETETTETEEILESPIQDITDGEVGVDDVTSDDVTSDDVTSDDVTSDDDITKEAEETPASETVRLLQSFKEALGNNDESKVAEIEALFKSIEDEKINLENKVASLSEELSIYKDRALRISADFDNFRKRTERDRLSLVTNAQGEVVENFLPVLDNFERAKAQMKVETEGEEKINNSYQSIYKQFLEILGSLSVESVETVGNPFDPMLHEAIMREDSSEFEEGIILQEFRKGFKLGDRLLRPSMVKVSAGPGPAKPEQVDQPEEADVGVISETESEAEPKSA